MIDAELHRVVMDAQPTTEKLDIMHPQRDRFAPPDAGVGQRQHQGAVPPGLSGQPAAF